MSKKTQQRQFVTGAIIGAAAVYFLTRRPAVVVFPQAPPGALEVLPNRLPQVSGQFSRDPQYYGNYGIHAAPLSPQRLYRPLAPPANFFI